jgi:hypothetical protein
MRKEADLTHIPDHAVDRGMGSELTVIESDKAAPPVTTSASQSIASTILVTSFGSAISGRSSSDLSIRRMA